MVTEICISVTLVVIIQVCVGIIMAACYFITSLPIKALIGTIVFVIYSALFIIISDTIRNE